MCRFLTKTMKLNRLTKKIYYLNLVYYLLNAYINIHVIFKLINLKLTTEIN